MEVIALLPGEPQARQWMDTYTILVDTADRSGALHGRRFEAQCGYDDGWVGSARPSGLAQSGHLAGMAGEGNSRVD